MLKRGKTFKPLDLASQNICHKHLLFMGIMPRKFHWEDLKTKRSLRHKLSVYGYVRILKKMGIIIEPLELASQKVCHEHQHFI